MGVSFEAVIVRLQHQVVQNVLANVTERRVPEIVRHARCFDYFCVQPPSGGRPGLIAKQLLAQSPPDLSHLDRMLLARVEDAAFPRADDLRDAGQPMESRRIRIRSRSRSNSERWSPPSFLNCRRCRSASVQAKRTKPLEPREPN